MPGIRTTQWSAKPMPASNAGAINKVWKGKIKLAAAKAPHSSKALWGLCMLRAVNEQRHMDVPGIDATKLLMALKITPKCTTSSIGGRGPELSRE